MTKPYDPLFRNTQENHDNTREKIFQIGYIMYLIYSSTNEADA